jgi:lipid-A-disaccharide synthase
MIVFFDYSILSIIGYLDVLKNIKKIIYYRNKITNYLLDENPNLFIGIDAPDFNFAIEKKLKKKGIPVVHVVSPSVWAWRQKRIHYMKKIMDHLFCLFPHEPQIYKKVSLPATFVGHFFANNIPIYPKSEISRTKLKLPKKTIIGLLPGSRSSEVENLMEFMLRTAELINNRIECFFLLSASSKKNLYLINNFLKKNNLQNFKLIIGHTYDLINSSDLLLVASGTATLEAALFKKPMIIIYKKTLIEYLIYKMLRINKFIGLPNILLGKNIVPEFIQHELDPIIISKKIIDILNDRYYLKKLKSEFYQLHKLLKLNSAELIYTKIKKYL